MNRRFSSTHPYDSSVHDRAIEALACQAQVPIEHVAQLYARELAVLTVGARISGFLPILTIRKVRELLRRNRHAVHDPAAPAPRDVDTRAHAQIAPPDKTVRSSI